MKIIFKNKFNLTIIFLFIFQGSLFAETPHFVDFKFILNQSEAGKKAQVVLKNKLENGIKKLQDKEKNIQEEEKKIIKQKKVLSAEEYKKKIDELRKKVSSLRKERNTLLDTVAKQRAKARSELLKNLNPILANYMKEKNIRMILDKKELIVADNKLDITKDIIELLNKKLKSIKVD